MEPQESKLIQTFGVARYFVGLAILAFTIIGLPILTHQSPMLIFMFTISLPGAVIIDPLLIVGVYFMFSSKFNWRIDLTALFVVIACSFAIYQLANIPQTGPENPLPANASASAS